MSAGPALTPAQAQAVALSRRTADAALNLLRSVTVYFDDGSVVLVFHDQRVGGDKSRMMRVRRRPFADLAPYVLFSINAWVTDGILVSPAEYSEIMAGGRV